MIFFPIIDNRIMHKRSVRKHLFNEFGNHYYSLKDLNEIKKCKIDEKVIKANANLLYFA